MAKNASKKTVSVVSSQPIFPYTLVPNALRKFLKMVPNKPKPPKVTGAYLKTCGLMNNNDRTIISVLKQIRFLSDAGDPTENYEKFMFPVSCGAVMAHQVRTVYAKLFETSHRPDRESDNDIKRLFNVNSGGGENLIRYQMNTFKVLCEFADFDAAQPATTTLTQTTTTRVEGSTEIPLTSSTLLPSVHIDLHIHLPENKTSRDYSNIIEDIARFIYRQEVNSNG